MRFSQKAIVYCYQILFLVSPLVFTTFNSELFEMPKMYFVYILTAIILAFHLYNYFHGLANLFKRTVLDIPLVLFLMSQSISTLLSVDPHTSFYGYYSRLNGGLLSVICYALLYWIMAANWQKDLVGKIINSSVISGLLVSAYAIAQHFGIDKNYWVQDVQNRVFSTFGQPNWLAAYLCILLPLSISQALNLYKDKKFLLSTIYNLSSTIFFLALLFTKSKSGIIAAIISLAIYFLLVILIRQPVEKDLMRNKQHNKISRFTRFFVSLRMTMFLITTFIVLSLTINNPVKDFFFPQKSSTIDNLPAKASAQADRQSTILITPSEDIRKIVWKGAVNLWAKFPLFGTGTETFAYSYYWVRPIEHNLTSEWDFLYNKAHNEYLNFLSTTGAFGLISYLFLILVSLITLFKSRKFELLAAYISILITNIAGFSVVVISLFFFLIPLFSQNITLSPTPKTVKTPFKEIGLFSSFIIIILCLQQTIFHYFADITYNISENYDNHQQFQQAYDAIKSSTTYHPQEPLYQNKLSLVAAKMAVVSASNDPSLAQKYTQEAIRSSDKAVGISPANINFWKERSQMFFYLSSLDSKYFMESINSLNKVLGLAPTDAKTYYLLGKFLESGNLGNEAAKYYQKAVDLKPNYDHAYFDLGKIYFENKNYPNARKNFESVLKYAPANKDARDYIQKIDQKI